MSLTDELQKLEQLRQNGTLTDEEFSKGKALLLAAPAPVSNVDMGVVVENQLNHLRHLNDLERIDREWQIERQRYEVVGRHGRRYIPSAGQSLATVLIGGTLGALWTAGAIAATSEMNSMGFESRASNVIGAAILPGIGILATLIAIISGLSQFIVSQNYQTAYRAYQRRHEQAALNTASHADLSSP